MEQFIEILAQSGPFAVMLGVVLWWFMQQNNKKMDSFIEAIKNLKEVQTEQQRSLRKAIYVQSKTVLMMTDAINKRNGHKPDEIIQRAKEELSKEIDEGIEENGQET